MIQDHNLQAGHTYFGPAYKGPIAVSVEFIDPRTAAFYLSNNGMNRKPKPTAISRYVKALNSGEFRCNGETIKFFGYGGPIADGQNRLEAIVRSGKGAWFVVVRGLTKDDAETIDQGVRRSPGDALSMAGIPNANVMAAAARLYHSYKNDGNFIISGVSSFLTNTQVVSVVENNPGLIESMRFVTSTSLRTGIRALLSESEAAFLHRVFADVSRDQADYFISRLSTGEGLQSESPILILRNRLISERAEKTMLKVKERLAICIKAWNFFRAGTPIRYLRWRSFGVKQESFPRAS